MQCIIHSLDIRHKTCQMLTSATFWAEIGRIRGELAPKFALPHQ
jgi:hypothetical protein